MELAKQDQAQQSIGYQMIRSEHLMLGSKGVILRSGGVCFTFYYHTFVQMAPRAITVSLHVGMNETLLNGTLY